MKITIETATCIEMIKAHVLLEPDDAIMMSEEVAEDELGNPISGLVRVNAAGEVQRLSDGVILCENPGKRPN